MDSTEATRMELVNCIHKTGSMVPALSDKLAIWNAFVAKRPSQWIPPEYYPGRPATPVRLQTAKAFLETRIPVFPVSSEEAFATKLMNTNGCDNVSQEGKSMMDQSKSSDFASDDLRKNAKNGRKQKATKMEKSRSKSASFVTEPRDEVKGTSKIPLSTYHFGKGNKQIQVKMPRKIVDKHAQGDRSSEVLNSSEEMLAHLAMNALKNGAELRQKEFPIPIVPQNSRSNIELINYKLTTQGSQISRRYSKPDGDSHFKEKRPPSRKGKAAFGVNGIQESNVKSGTLLPSTNDNENGGPEKKVPHNINTEEIGTISSRTSSPKSTLFSQLPFLSPIQDLTSPTPKSKEKDQGHQSSPQKPRRRTKTSVNNKQLQLAEIIKNAVIEQLPKGMKGSNGTLDIPPKAQLAQRQTPVAESTPAERMESSRKLNTKKSRQQEPKKDNLENVKTKETGNGSVLRVLPSSQPNSSVFTALMRKESFVNASISKCPQKEKEAAAELMELNSTSPAVKHFSRTQHKLIGEQLKHVFHRQVVLESDVLQLLESLQEKVDKNLSSPESEKPCCCDAETKDKLESIVRKQKEVIQLQVDLHQRYGLKQFGKAIKLGRSQPILNAFEAHYGQLSTFARELHGKMVYYCASCNFAAKDELIFRKHLESSGHVVRTYQGIIKHQPLFSCQFCSQKFSGTTKYMNHMVSSDGKGPKCKQDIGHSGPPRPKSFAEPRT